MNTRIKSIQDGFAIVWVVAFFISLAFGAKGATSPGLTSAK